MVLPLVPFAFHCISGRQLVGVGVQGSFKYRWHTEAEVKAAVPASAAPPPKRQFDE